ncbi:MAG: tyrosine-type recombinase/integrase [Opitutaceae bacterium]
MRRAKRLLEGTNLSLLDAVKLAIDAHGKGAMPAKQSATIDDAIDAFLQRALRVKLREQTYDFYETKLKAFTQAFPGRRLGELSRKEIKAWVDALPGSYSNRKGYLGSVCAVYNYALSLEPPLCQANPVARLKLEGEPIDESEATVLHAEEVRTVLAAAGPYRHAIALMVFVGIRPDEIAGRRKDPLEWKHVDRKGRRIRIPASISKTRSPRVIEDKRDWLVPGVLWDWLEDGPGEGPICPALAKQAIRRVWPALRANRPDLKAWPRDVLRHTAGSYLLALWDDAGRVSQVLGHEGKTEMLYRHYRAVMTEMQALAIAALRPPTTE